MSIPGIVRRSLVVSVVIVSFIFLYIQASNHFAISATRNVPPLNRVTTSSVTTQSQCSSSQHDSYCAPPLPPQHPLDTATISPHEHETQLAPNVTLFSRTSSLSDPVLLWLTLTHDTTSWGTHNFRHRTIHDFLSLVTSQVQPVDMTLALLTSSPTEYQDYITATRSHAFARVTIVLHGGFNRTLGTIPRAHRQDKSIQGARRAELAKLRNFLMLHSLEDELHILWTDADVHRYDSGIVRRMLSHADTRSDVGIITARCSQGGNDNYDHNAWRGTRQGPRGWDLTDTEISAGELKTQGQQHVPKIIEGSEDDELRELDVVGATILYVRASLVWQGLSFATQYAVGTRWGKDGWDGIESEGLCYRARGLEGGKCMVLGGGWHVEHTKG